MKAEAKNDSLTCFSLARCSFVWRRMYLGSGPQIPWLMSSWNQLESLIFSFVAKNAHLRKLMTDIHGKDGEVLFANPYIWDDVLFFLRLVEMTLKSPSTTPKSE